MSVCPKDFKPCCDDLCRAGGCMKTGTQILSVCPVCNNLYNDDELTCACPEYGGEDDQ